MIFQNLHGWQSRLSQAVLITVRTATKRSSGGKSANKNTAGRRLGPKKGEGEFVQPGQIIWRQRGTAWYPGENVGIGRDHTIFAKEPGFVRFYRDPFHAKRRFIGIALDKDAKLPTPHFAPRRRRFGYTPIDNDQVAEYERQYLTKKETERAIVREDVLKARVQARDSRLASRKEFIQDNVPSLEDSGLALQADRLERIYQYLCGGFTQEEARKVVDSNIIDDIHTETRVNKLAPETADSKVSAFTEAAKLVDSKVKFGPSYKLMTLHGSQSAEEEAFAQAVAEVENLATPHLESTSGTPEEVVNKVLEILQNPLFSAKEVASLKRKYLRRPLPILLSDKSAREPYEKKVKKGEGEIREIWDHENRCIKSYFVPPRAKEIFK